jgi:hypothetical protein
MVAVRTAQRIECFKCGAKLITQADGTTRQIARASDIGSIVGGTRCGHEAGRLDRVTDIIARHLWLNRKRQARKE